MQIFFLAVTREGCVKFFRTDTRRKWNMRQRKIMDFCPNSAEEHEKQSELCNISAVEQEPLSDYLDTDVLWCEVDMITLYFRQPVKCSSILKNFLRRWNRELSQIIMSCFYAFIRWTFFVFWFSFGAQHAQTVRSGEEEKSRKIKKKSKKREKTRKTSLNKGMKLIVY